MRKFAVVKVEHFEELAKAWERGEVIQTFATEKEADDYAIELRRKHVFSHYEVFPVNLTEPSSDSVQPQPRSTGSRLRGTGHE